MAAKTNTTMNERLEELEAISTGAGTQPQETPENAQPLLTQEMIDKMVQEALAKRTAELDAREAALAEKVAAAAAPTQTTANTSAAVPAKPDPWKEKREIFLPYATKGEEQFILVGVNGRKYQVPRGKNVTLPLPLYERIQIMLEANARTVEYRESLPNEAYPTGEAVRVG